MLTGVVLTTQQQQAAGRRDEGMPFDPRPWPMVVGMLAGLVGVFLALRPAAGPAGVGGAGDAPRAAAVAVPPVAEGKEAPEQGVTLSFEQGGKADRRAARVMSLYVPENSPPTPFLGPGKFTATFAGFVNLRLRGEYTFSVLGRGKVAVKVGGQVVLEASGDDFGGKASGLIKMEKGKNAIEVAYASPEKGDAWVRVLWANREFPPEPVQPTVLSHDVGSKALREAARLRDGRELLANLRCGNCHANPNAGAAGAMPELAADAPDLSDAGARLKAGWMAAWIADPRALRADASMPKVLHGADASAGAGDLAAYLATLGKPATGGVKEADDEAVAQGGQLFAGLGCIGCHTKPDAEEVDVKGGRLALKNVNAKFQAGGLRAWLLNPQEHYQWARMPNFHLTEFEADRLVAYLGKNAKGDVAGNASGDAAKGKALFASAGCASCHKMKDGAGTLAARSMGDLLEKSDWTKGCLAADDAGRGKAPNFGLSDEQRGALKAIAAAGLSSLASDVLPEFAERAVRHLQCAACHARDEVEDRWSALADEVSDMAPPESNIETDQTEEAAKGPKVFVPRGLGKLHAGDQIVISGDQARPALTWTGEKLRPEWAGRFIAGEMAYKPRYWMRARMPGFGAARGQAIARGLALEHGFPAQGTAAPAAAAAKADQVEIGVKLVGRDGGFACITCHSIVDTKAISPFEAPAPNFLHAAERLNHDYYLRWMRKPMRFQPGTKMPQFSEDGKTTLKEVLEGDADKQFEAIWQYMLQGEGMMPPE